jgi:hypothetical protein
MYYKDEPRLATVNVKDQVSHPYKKMAELWFYIFQHLHSWTAGGKTKYSEPNGSKHSPNLVRSSTLRECSFDLLVSFPNILTLPNLQKTYYLSLCCACALRSYNVTLTYLVFFGFASRPISLLASHRTSVFFCMLAMFSGAGVAQSVWCLATDWTTGRSRFDPQQRQEIFPLISVSRPALWPTHPSVQWVSGILSRWVKRGHSPPSTAEVANEYELYIFSPCASIGVLWDCFTFLSIFFPIILTSSA